MTVELFAGIAVSDLAAALTWYEQFFGAPPSFLPNEREAIWEVAPHRYIFIELRPEDAGHSRHLLFVDDLDARIARIAELGISPEQRETLANGVRKVTYRDPDGNQLEFGGPATDTA